MDVSGDKQVNNQACPLTRYCSSQEAIPPRIVPTEAEAQQLTPDQGLRVLGMPPAEEIETVAAPPTTVDEAKTNRYLWAVAHEAIPYAFERTCISGLDVIKHTNLTGGLKAFSGGELWFINDRSFAFNGSSGRYGPRTETHLDHICSLFLDLGYRVACTGFDVEANRSRPVFLEGEVHWMEAAQ